jgi:hypothetical protein
VHGTQDRHDVLVYQEAVALESVRRQLRLHVLKPALEELPNRHPGGIHVEAALHFGDEARAFVLRLPLGTVKGVPALPALVRLRIAHVEHNCPFAGRALLEMAPHFFTAFLTSVR